MAAWLLLAAQMLCSICAGKRWAAARRARRRCSTSHSRATHHTSIASLTAHHRARQSLQRRTARPRLSPDRSPATAGLYNELLLKSGQDATGQKVSTNLQNAFMYVASVLWLLLYPYSY